MLSFDAMISFCIGLLRPIFLCFFATLFWCGASPAQGQSTSRRLATERTIWQRNNPQFEALPLELSSQNHFIVRAFINGKPANKSAHDEVILRGKFERDRKSTRLNSSHSQISYAVFCLKKK